MLIFEDFRLDLKNISDPFGARHGFRELAGDPRHRPERFVHTGQIGGENQNLTREYPALDHLERTEEDDRTKTSGADYFSGTSRCCLQARRLDSLLESQAALCFETLLFVLLPREGSHQMEGCQHFMDTRCHHSLTLALFPSRCLDPAVDREERVANQWKCSQGDQA